MKRPVIGGLLLLLGQRASAQLASIPELPFDAQVVASNVTMPPGVFLGEVAGVDINSRGNIFVYTRTGESGHILFRRSAQLFEFTSSGKFVREIGGRNNYVMGWAHSVRVDKDDNIWIVDSGTNLLAKFDPQGRLLMALGRRNESVAAFAPMPKPGERSPLYVFLPNEPGVFGEPTDVAFDDAGNIFVSDGYQNAQVQKFDKDGHFVKRWGTPGTEPGQFRLPHGIATDSQGNVYVADRGNNRIQVFDNDGRFLRQIRLDIRVPKDQVLRVPGLVRDNEGVYRSLWPNSICISRGPNPAIYTNDITPSVVIKMSLDGTVIGRMGTEGRKVGQLGWMHEMACTRNDNEVYVSEMINFRVQKLTVRSNTPTSR